VRVNVKADINGIIQLISAQMIEEVEAEDKAGDEKEGEEKKKKITKVNLDTSTSRPIEWSDAEVKVANEMEVAMENTDRIVRETANMQNELESYIYNMRDKICSDSHLGPYGTEEEKSNFVAKSEATQNWLYDDAWDATKSMFAEKLAELKQIGGPIESRMTEALGRDGALKTLQSTLQLYQNWVNESQTNESYSHITDEEREKVRSVTEEVSSWMYEMMDKQGSLAANQEPVLKIAALVQKTKDLKASCDPTMRKPKPAPKKEEPPKPEEKKPENAEETKDATMEDAVKPDAPEGNGENAAMDVDPK
jgi:heat shock 70kDa protein 4